MIEGINVFLTRSCNLRCPYCFVEKNGAGHMKEKKRAETLSFMIANMDLFSPKTHIGYIGGEPLLAFDNLMFFTEELRSINKRINLGFTTNGVLIDEHICEYLMRNDIRTVVSMDGTTEAMKYRRMQDGSNVHDRVVESIKMLLSYHVNTLVQMTITPDNASDFLKNVKHIASIGVEKILFGIDYEADWSLEELDSFAIEINRVFSWYYEVFRCNKRCSLKYIDNELISYILFSAGRKVGCSVCPIGKSILAIDVDGEIYPCQAFVDASEWSIGNVTSGIDIKKQAMVCHIDEITPCNNCKLNSFCRKCPRCNYLICGDAAVVNHVSCRVNREMYHNLEWFFLKLKQEKNNRFISEFGDLLKLVRL